MRELVWSGNSSYGYCMRDWADEWLFNEFSKKLGITEDSSHQLLNWARASRERRPVAFIGAGMSFNARPRARFRELGFRGMGEPRALSWKELSDRFRSELRSDGEDGESDALWLAELYEQAFGPDALMRVIRDAVPDDYLAPGAAHEALYDIGWHAILTTNYDTLIERAWKATHAPGRIQPCSTDADLVRSAGQEKALEIIHLHGVLNRPETIVLTLEQYRKYPKRSPGLLTKVRQLFLQHPVLLIGFSATDPNFIQWNGWLSDLVGPQRNPWVSLSVGPAPGAARRNYWKGALSFVPISPEQLTGVLHALGKYLRDGFSRDDTISIALERVKRAASIDELARGLPGLLSIQRTPVNKDGDARKREIFTAALRRAFVLRLGELSAERLWTKISKLGLRTGGSGGLMVEQSELRREIREALGVEWFNWLAVAVAHLGLRFRIGRVLFLAFEEERLAVGLSPDARRTLGLSILEQEILRGAAGNDELVGRLVEDTSLRGSEKLRLAHMGQIRNLRMGLPIEAESEPQTAQALRCQGFVFQLVNNAERALDAFSRAAFLSRDESEPELIEWLTIRSALYAAGVGSNGGVNPAMRGIELEQLHSRRVWLESQVDSIRQFRALEVRSRDDLISRMVKDESMNDDRGPPQSSSKVLSILEGAWASPILAGRAAELYGQAQWRAGNHVESARALCRYGSRKLAPLIESFQALTERSNVDPQLLAALTQKGRWFLEWISRAETLVHLIPELPEPQLVELWAWILEATRSVPPVAVKRGEGSMDPEESMVVLSKLAIARWADLRPAYLLKEWGDLIASERAEYKALAERIAADFQSLPFSFWFYAQRITVAEFDRVFSSAMRLVRKDEDRLDLLGHLRWNMDYDEIGVELIAPAGEVADVIRDWLGAIPATSALRLHVVWSVFINPHDVAGQQDAVETVFRMFNSEEQGYSNVEMLQVLGDLAQLHDESMRRVMPELLVGVLRGISNVSEGSAERMLLVDAVAFVVRRSIEARPQEPVSALEDVLILALDMSSIAVIHASRVSALMSPRLRDVLFDKIGHAVTRGRSQAGISARLFAAVAIYGVLEVNPEGALRLDWLLFACVLCRDADSDIARSYLRVISKLLLSGRLTPSSSVAYGQCVDSVIDAARDPRAEMVGSAVFWLARILRSCPLSDERKIQVQDVLRLAGRDSRAGVVSSLWLAAGDLGAQTVDV